MHRLRSASSRLNCCELRPPRKAGRSVTALGCRVGEGERPRGVGEGLRPRGVAEGLRPRGVLGRLLGGAEVVAGSVARALRLVSGVAARGLAIDCSSTGRHVPTRNDLGCFRT